GLVIRLDRHPGLGKRHPVAIPIDDLRVDQVAKDLDDAPLPRRRTAAELLPLEPRHGTRDFVRPGAHETDRLASPTIRVDFLHVRAKLRRDAGSLRAFG